MKCTVIVDNWAPVIWKRPFLAEHGFSLLIEYDDCKVLFDTGYSQIVTYNLSLLNVHPAQIDALVLSHGHTDHVGGLLPFLQMGNKEYPVYAHPGIFTPRYHSIMGVDRIYRGIPYTRTQLTCLGAEWRLSEDPQEIAPNLWFSGQIPRKTSFEPGDNSLIILGTDGREHPDPVVDDVALFHTNERGLVVIGGCTHSGLVNTVQYGFEITGANRLSGWIGGAHLGPATIKQQDKTLGMIEELDPDFVMSGHCTGFKMMAELSRLLGNRFIPGAVGTEIVLT